MTWLLDVNVLIGLIDPTHVLHEAAPVLHKAAPVLHEAAPVLHEAAPVLHEAAPVLHEAAPRWFSSIAGDPWATCPMTENAVMRIVGHPKYPNSAGSPAAVAPIVMGLRALAGHVFWADDLSLVAFDRVDTTAIETPGQVTDTDLLALAVSKAGCLATFDRRLSTRALRDFPGGLHVIAGAA